ncbi:MAG: TetR/AcrR family transcriptional regulator [Bryobacteraceae bacterium]
MEKQRPYHRENLRSTLIAAGLAVIAESGVRGLTLREVARRAEVSHNAPYRHFDSKQALLAAIATEGFERLAAEVREAGRAGNPPIEQLLAGCEAYLAFARRHPAHYEVMFSEQVQKAEFADCARAAEGAFAGLVQAIEVCRRERFLAEGDSREQARVVWSLLDGMAHLSNGEQFRFRTEKEFRDFARSALIWLLDGLGRRKGEAGRLSVRRSPA